MILFTDLKKSVSEFNETCLNTQLNIYIYIYILISSSTNEDVSGFFSVFFAELQKNDWDFLRNVLEVVVLNQRGAHNILEWPCKKP